MSSYRQERLSKTKVTEKSSTMMIHQPRSTKLGHPMQLKFPGEIWNSYEPGRQLLLRFPKAIWNSYNPHEPNETSSLVNTEAGQKRKHMSTPPERENEPATTLKHQPLLVPRHCKVKVTRFQYGGPKARTQGKYRDMITLETPCLRPTCGNCWRWHRHLMGRPLGVPGIDDDDGAKEGEIVEIPLKSVAMVMKLAFTTELSRTRFRDLVHEQGRKAWRERERLRDLREEVLSSTGDAGPRRQKRRYRIKLVFKTGQGKVDYRRLVERYLW